MFDLSSNYTKKQLSEKDKQELIEWLETVGGIKCNQKK